MWDVVAYCCAGLIMYPFMPSEVYGADGNNGRNSSFNGSDQQTGQLAYWEYVVSLIGVVDVVSTLINGANLAALRFAGVDANLDDVVDASLENALIVFFCLDALVKMVAYKSMRAYIRSTLNNVDLVCTVLVVVGALTWRCPSVAGLRVLRLICVLNMAWDLSNFRRVRYCFSHTYIHTYMHACIGIC